jgi:hypothetical protein
MLWQLCWVEDLVAMKPGKRDFSGWDGPQIIKRGVVGALFKTPILLTLRAQLASS